MTEPTYLNFDLWIGRTAEGYRAKAVDSFGREETVAFQMPFTELEVENFWLRIGRPRRGMRRVQSPEVEAAESLGGRLFESVFHGELLSCFRASLEEAKSTHAGLRIRLRLAEVPELADLPWEYLYDQRFDLFLGLSRSTPVVRYLELPARVQPLVVEPPLTMLVMLASPSDYESLEVEREWTQLNEALADLRTRRLIELQRLEGATLPNLQRRLDGGEIHIFHFIGHGGFDERTQEGVLIFEDESGRGKPITSDQLGVLLHDHTSLRLAFLNACEGARPCPKDAFAGIAQTLIQKGIPAVIAMQSEIPDEVGATLAQNFYSALAAGNPVDAGLTEARKAIFFQGSVEWGVPVLYLRAPNGRIFDLEEMQVHDGGRMLPASPLLEDPSLAEAAIGSSPRAQSRQHQTWNVPYRRNPFFTGREDVLETLHQALNGSGKTAQGQVQGISGLGGIGKTQTAVAFAHRFRNEYDAVLWSVASSEADLVAGFVEIAQVLGLPERNAPEQEAVEAVRRWLDTTGSWLLVLDNADQPEIVEPFLPASPRGHLLVTSRARNLDVLDVVRAIRLDALPPEDAWEFLLKRTDRKAPGDDERQAAAGLAEALGYLPLALEQAGAYLAAHPVRFCDYLESYHQRRLPLLAEGAPRQYPESVATTWALNFEQVELASEAAAEVLRLSAFLSPDRIPLELLSHGVAELGPVLAEPLARAEDDPVRLGNLLEPLTRYSLVRADLEDRTYSLHRLVQEVVKDTMGTGVRGRWAERTVRALNRAFPEIEFANWARCERLLAHARSALRLIEEDPSLEIEEAGRLLNQVGTYCLKRGRFATAGPPFHHALEIRKKVFGDEHRYVATSLNNLAALYRAQGRYEEAAPLYLRALEIREKVLGSEHPHVGESLNNLAILYHVQARLDDAESLHQRALEISEKSGGSEHPNVAFSLNNLANLYRDQDRYDEAMPLLQRALEIRARVLGRQHPHVATSLNSLANLYRDWGHYTEAIPLFQQALEIREQVLGGEHPHVADSLNSLANLYRDQGRYDEAEPLYQRARAVREKVLGGAHPHLADNLNDLANLYRDQGRYDQAEPLYQRAQSIRKKALGPEHPDFAATLKDYAALLHRTSREEEAIKLEAQAQTIQRATRPSYPDEDRKVCAAAILTAGCRRNTSYRASLLAIPQRCESPREVSLDTRDA